MSANGTCPRCGNSAYVGLREVECYNLGCENCPPADIDTLWLYSDEYAAGAD